MKLKVTPVISLIRLAILSNPHTNSKYVLLNTMSAANHTVLSKSRAQARLQGQSGNGSSLWKSNKQIWFVIWCFRSGVCAAAGKFMVFEIHITNKIKERHIQESLKMWRKCTYNLIVIVKYELFLNSVVNFPPLRNFVSIVLYIIYGGRANENKNVLTHPKYNPFSLCVLSLLVTYSSRSFPLW